MPTFLERYQRGEREEVWNDLERLGAAVREKEHLADARAVAEETMKRVRDNAQTLVERLEKLGYQFLSQSDDLAGELQDMSQMMEQTGRMAARALRQYAPDPRLPGFQAPIERLRSQGRNLRPPGPARWKMVGAVAGMFSKSRGERKGSKSTAISPPRSYIADEIAKYEASIGGPIPLSLRAWCEIVGSVSLVGTHPTLCFLVQRRAPRIIINRDFALDAEREAAELQAMGINASTTVPEVWEPPLADPLEIFCDFEECDYDEDEEEAGHHLILGTDDRIKGRIYGHSEPYSMAVPNAGADAPFADWHEASFVGYLRTAFRWGGFPGWERYSDRPEKELAYLAEGLLPI